MEHIVNQITVRGQLVDLPEFSHENHGKRFYRFYLDIPRLSGNSDCLPVVVEERILDTVDLSGGSMLTVTGQIRSHNTRTGGSRHLLIFIFALTIVAEDGEPCNDVILEGPICKEPIYRRTPLGREICDAMLAVPRSFRRADYRPASFGVAQQRIYPSVTPGIASVLSEDSKAVLTSSAPKKGKKSVLPTKFLR